MAQARIAADRQQVARLVSNAERETARTGFGEAVAIDLRVQGAACSASRVRFPRSKRWPTIAPKE
jgi:hypothetical protein